MTTTDKIARRKLTLLQLASDLDNVSRACKLAGYSRQQCGKPQERGCRGCVAVATKIAVFKYLRAASRSARPKTSRPFYPL